MIVFMTLLVRSRLVRLRCLADLIPDEVLANLYLTYSLSGAL